MFAIEKKIGIPNLSQFPGIGQNSDGDISDFQIFVQPFIIENCDNSRTSHDIDIKPGLVIKLDKRNSTPSKKFDKGVMSTKFDIIVFFPIYGQVASIRKPWSIEAWSIKLTFSLRITSYLA